MKYIILFIAFLFIASTYTPYRGYDEYVATITQSETNDPIAIVFDPLESGEITFGRGDVGKYTLNSSTAFTENKTLIQVSSGNITEQGGAIIESTWVNSSVINLTVYLDGVLSDISDHEGRSVFITIRIYQ